MKKFIVLCSALVFGLCSESYAWEVDLDEVTIGGETTIDKEPFTPKLSLVAVQERMSKLKSVSGSTGLGQRVFRRLYNSWLSDNSKWTGQGRNSTIDNIQGYCNQKFLPAFEEVLRSIEKQIEKATPEDEGEGQEEGSSKEAQEKAIDTADEIKEDKKIQRGKLEAVTDALEASLYTGINDGEEVAPDMTNIDAAFASIDLTSLADLWGQDKIGVDVDEDFVVSLKRVWAMQALNMSDSRRLDRYGKYAVEVEGDDKNTWYKPIDDSYNPNSFVDGAGAGHAATFLLDHFRGTDTRKESGTWDLHAITGFPLQTGEEKADTFDQDDRSTGDDGKLLLQHLFNEYDSRKTTSTDSSEQTTEKMTYHLNLAARLLTEIAKEKDRVVKDESGIGGDRIIRIEEYKVDSIVFHAFRQYMTQALREAITLIKEKESSGS